MVVVNKILDFCVRHCFLKSENGSRQFALGPVGELLKENIYNEWASKRHFVSEHVYPMPTMKSTAANNEDLQENVTISKLWNYQKSPIVFEQQKSDIFLSQSNHVELVNSNRQAVLNKYIFLQHEKSEQYFNEWQHICKFWWRQIAALPGRFHASDVVPQDKSYHLQISAQFPWGSHCVENLSLIQDLSLLKSECNFINEVDFGASTPHVLVSKVGLENATVAILLDAYNECTSISCRELMSFTRSLAPYKIGFTAIGSDDYITHDLYELADFLAKHLNEKGVATCPVNSSELADLQFVQNDKLGVPYTVVLRDSTLHNGIIGLRCRDTTLEEQVHVTDLRSHVRQLFKNK